MATWLIVILIVLAVIALLGLLHIFGVFDRFIALRNDYIKATVPINNL